MKQLMNAAQLHAAHGMQGYSGDAHVFNAIKKAVEQAKVVFVSLDGYHSDSTVRVSDGTYGLLGHLSTL